MNARVRFVSSWLMVLFATGAALACCPAPPSGKPVVNADQTVIMIWDAAAKTQHFIRQASFKSDADDFGFIVPCPSEPELAESGNEAFAYLKKLTEPAIQKVPRPRGGSGCGCPGSAVPPPMAAKADVRVLQEKLVAGFNAVVLEADSSDALVRWLKDHGYAFSPEVEAWAKPYVGAGWKFTALKVARNKEGRPSKDVSASALRLTIKTDKPLFPYREPDSSKFANALAANHRLLRIFFIGDGRYQAELGNQLPLQTTVWSNALSANDRTILTGMLKLPENTGPATWWLTEFEHVWPYKVAPADVYFSRSTDQSTIVRPPIIEYVSATLPDDGSIYAIAAFVVVTPIVRRIRRSAAPSSRLNGEEPR